MTKDELEEELHNTRTQLTTAVGELLSWGEMEPPPPPPPFWATALSTGDVLRLEHAATGFRITLVVDRRGDRMLLARPDQPCDTPSPDALPSPRESPCPPPCWQNHAAAAAVPSQPHRCAAAPPGTIG